MIDLGDFGISHAEYAVLFHVMDTVVEPRDSLASWVAQYLPNNVPADISIDDCRRAIEALVQRGLLVELTETDLAADLARWRAEPLPVSWGVDRNRRVGDVDVTQRGFDLYEATSRGAYPKATNHKGYNTDEPGVIRVFGETEPACVDATHSIVERIDQHPWHWPRGAATIEPTRRIGPWWYSRFERIATGFEAIVRRVG